MIRYIFFFSTLSCLLLSGSNTHFNYCYYPTLALVNEINTTNVDLKGKDNQLEHSSKLDYRIRTVVIDAGHGGHDSGCSGAHSKEKHVSLKISKKLGEYIGGKFPKVKVIYTRDKDVFVPLHTRAKIANDNNADLFISIHCNAIRTQKHLVRGTETYVMGLHDAEENLEVAKRENEAILLEKDYEKNYAGFDPNSPTGHIILAMVQNAFLEQSISLAQKIEHNFAIIAKRKSRGVKQAGFLVLRETTMPSVLIESGYLSNLKEEKYMDSSKGQDELAFAIFKAFESYKKEVELENSTSAPALPAKSTKVLKSQKVNPTTNSKELLQKRYMVQIAASSKKIKTKSRKWRKLKFPLQIKQEKGNFKYLAGDFATLTEANNARKKLLKSGFKGAFVVAYRGNKKVKI